MWIHITILILRYGDLTDSNNIYNLISKIKPDEVYNLELKAM